MDHKTYTEEEIVRKINELKEQEEMLILQRKDLNEKIRQKRSNIKYWEDMSIGQYKMFE